MFELIEEIRAVHQREGQPGDRILGKQFVNVTANQVRTAQSAGLHRESFGLKPLL